MKISHLPRARTDSWTSPFKSKMSSPASRWLPANLACSDLRCVGHARLAPRKLWGNDRMFGDVMFCFHQVWLQGASNILLSFTKCHPSRNEAYHFACQFILHPNIIIILVNNYTSLIIYNYHEILTLSKLI